MNFFQKVGSLFTSALTNISRISMRNYYDINNIRWCRYGVVPANVTIKEWEKINDAMFVHHHLKRWREKGPQWPRKRRPALYNEQGLGAPQMKGIVLRTCIKKPKKPNSANRKCVLLRLSCGRERVAFVPGVGHNLQEHSVVLVEEKRVPDVPGLRIRVKRGIYDCAPIVRQSQRPG